MAWYSSSPSGPQNFRGIEGKGAVQTSSPAAPSRDRPRSSRTSTAMPNVGPWISPACTGNVGSPPTKEPHRSVPPDIDARWTSSLMSL